MGGGWAYSWDLFKDDTYHGLYLGAYPETLLSRFYLREGRLQGDCLSAPLYQDLHLPAAFEGVPQDRPPYLLPALYLYTSYPQYPVSGLYAHLTRPGVLLHMPYNRGLLDVFGNLDSCGEDDGKQDYRENYVEERTREGYEYLLPVGF